MSLVALIGGAPVGFIVLADGGLIDQLYVHPAVARTGVASALLDAIEKLAARAQLETSRRWMRATRRSPCSTSAALPPSAATPFPVEDVWLGNTRMKKKLT